MTGPLAIPATGWRLPDRACNLLTGLVTEYKPTLIVECGSGRSTVVLADTARPYGGRIVALEHDSRYAAETRALLVEHSVEETATVRDAPLERDWYARSTWDDLHGIGMLLVDGPPGHVAPLARKPALTLLRDRLLPGCVVVLDDVDRPDEQQIMADWGIEMVCVKHEAAWIGYGTLDGERATAETS